MQTLQNQKIEEMRAGRRSENRLDGRTVKSTGDQKTGERRNWYLFAVGLDGKFLGQRIIGTLFVPEDADNPPALAIVGQLETVDAAGEGRFTGGAAGFVATEDLGDVAKRLHAAHDRAFEKTVLCEIAAGARYISFHGARTNVNIPFAVLSGGGESGARQKQGT